MFFGMIKLLPFEDESFDIIICTEVLNQVDDIDNTINELKKSLEKRWKTIHNNGFYFWRARYSL